MNSIMTKSEDNEIKSPHYIELKSVKEMGRLVCAYERIPLPVLNIDKNGNKILIIQLDTFKKRPIIYFVKITSVSHYLSYKNSEGMEESKLTNTADNPIFSYSPIISLNTIPEILKETTNNDDETEKYNSVLVKDLANLAKVCSYKSAFEDPPLPIFAFQNNDKYIIGTFTRIDESDDGCLFFYQEINDIGNNNFLKFPISNPSNATLTDKIEEHGYIFIKIIRLMKSHPLVELK